MWAVGNAVPDTRAVECVVSVPMMPLQTSVTRLQ